jgi:hypothetical protein
MASRLDGSAGRAVALATLLVFAAVALRGYLPGAAERVPRAPSADSPAASVVVVVLLLGSVAIVALAVVMRARNRTPGQSGAASTPAWLRRDAGRLSWRVLVIAFVVVLGWLAIAMALSGLGGGGAVKVPGPAPGATPDSAPAPEAFGDRPKEPKPQDDSSLIGYFYVGTVGFLGVLLVGAIVTSHRAQRSVSPGAEFGTEPEAAAPDADSRALVRAAEVGLAAVEDPSREPRKAIIACYAAMERELARVPGAAPQDYDTASEVLARAVGQRALEPGSATALVELFDEARFSPHVMTEHHREAAVEALQQVLAELPSRA